MPVQPVPANDQAASTHDESRFRLVMVAAALGLIGLVLVIKFARPTTYYSQGGSLPVPHRLLEYGALWTKDGTASNLQYCVLLPTASPVLSTVSSLKDMKPDPDRVTMLQPGLYLRGREVDTKAHKVFVIANSGERMRPISLTTKQISQLTPEFFLPANRSQLEKSEVWAVIMQQVNDEWPLDGNPPSIVLNP